MKPDNRIVWRASDGEVPSKGILSLVIESTKRDCRRSGVSKDSTAPMVCFFFAKMLPEFDSVAVAGRCGRRIERCRRVGEHDASMS